MTYLENQNLLARCSVLNESIETALEAIDDLTSLKQLVKESGSLNTRETKFALLTAQGWSNYFELTSQKSVSLESIQPSQNKQVCLEFIGKVLKGIWDAIIGTIKWIIEAIGKVFGFGGSGGAGSSESAKKTADKIKTTLSGVALRISELAKEKPEITYAALKKLGVTKPAITSDDIIGVLEQHAGNFIKVKNIAQQLRAFTNRLRDNVKTILDASDSETVKNILAEVDTDKLAVSVINQASLEKAPQIVAKKHSEEFKGQGSVEWDACIPVVKDVFYATLTCIKDGTGKQSIKPGSLQIGEPGTDKVNLTTFTEPKLKSLSSALDKYSVSLNGVERVMEETLSVLRAISGRLEKESKKQDEPDKERVIALTESLDVYRQVSTFLAITTLNCKRLGGDIVKLMENTMSATDTDKWVTPNEAAK